MATFTNTTSSITVVDTINFTTQLQHAAPHPRFLGTLLVSCSELTWYALFPRIL